MSDMKTPSFLPNLSLGLHELYLETIFPLCRGKMVIITKTRIYDCNQ